jgi:hypothetical protein
MVVWGGSVLFTDVGTGGRYDPALDSWKPTSGAGAPSPRSKTKGVWTGRQMIVWGGGANLNTGASYDPSEDVWTPTTMVGAPSGRANHTAVWTGSEMIVWGGYDGSPLNTGARYTPSPEKWVPVAATGAPGTRYDHSAVWTGSEMIVWGGTTVGINPTLNDGGRYDPRTNAWVPTPATTLRRTDHSAVWTGRDMIVWGGVPPGGGSANDGALYNPEAGTWTVTQAIGAPSARHDHVAIWTGTEMIVWGGVVNSKTGGRYSPATDTWTATSVPAIFPGRLQASGVWTGTSMIVWGGTLDTNGYTSLNDGGVYCAADCETPQTWYLDHDADGYGQPGVPVIACTQPVGFVPTGDDCDDTRATVHPGAEEICDARDNDCDGFVDEGFGPTGAVQGLRFVDRNTIVWPPQSQAVSYDLLKGDLSSLSSRHGNFTLTVQQCLTNDGTGLSGVDPSIPVGGRALYYLLRANGCGFSGTYDEGDPAQVAPRDAQIQASASACP